MGAPCLLALSLSSVVDMLSTVCHLPEVYSSMTLLMLCQTYIESGILEGQRSTRMLGSLPISVVFIDLLLFLVLARRQLPVLGLSPVCWDPTFVVAVLGNTNRLLLDILFRDLGDTRSKSLLAILRVHLVEEVDLLLCGDCEVRHGNRPCCLNEERMREHYFLLSMKETFVRLVHFENSLVRRTSDYSSVLSWT